MDIDKGGKDMVTLCCHVINIIINIIKDSSGARP